MENNGGSRQRWTAERRRKEPSLYDDYLNEEKAAQQHPQSTRRQSFPLRLGDTAPAITTSLGGTVRVVTPELPTSVDEGADNGRSMVPERGTTSFERAFIPHTTTTIVGGRAAAAGSSPVPTGSKSRRLVKERDRIASHSPPSSRNGSSVAEMLGRSSSKSNGHSAQMAMRDAEAYNSARPRTRTLEERRRERSPNQSSKRMGSVNLHNAAPSLGAEYLASVPASTSPPSAPSISSVGSAVQAHMDASGRRSISPVSTSVGDSMASSLPGSSARRIMHLTRTLNGRMSGNVILRRDPESSWGQLYCYIHEDTGALMYEPRSGEGVHRTLVSALQGCGVRHFADGDTPYLELSIPQSDTEMHLKLLTQADFDCWYAALLWWQSLGPKPLQSNGPRPPSSSASWTPVRPEPPPRTSSNRHHRDRDGSAKSAKSTKSNRRKSVVSSLKEAPVIKIGKMIYWDTNVGYSNSPGTSEFGQPATGRPQAYRMQSMGSRRWRRISGQLRENGELKLHSDADNSLISVVQLSQLSRCAIQRLDPSVLENEFCIAIYPQYTSSPSNSQPGFVRPIFLSLENRVLYEVWLVLLRAFTIPQLYGPRIQSAKEENTIFESGQDVESMLATKTTDMFRMERTLNIRIVEAKMYPPASNAVSPDTGFSGGHTRVQQPANGKPEQQGYYAEVLLDNETRGKTVVKYDGLSPLWAESFEFPDLPPVLNSASVVIKRRPSDQAHAREQHESRLVHEAYGFTGDQHGGFTAMTFDITCGKVEIYLQELEEEKELEKWWPVINMYNQRVGEVLIRARAEEGVILMARDYQPLTELLHRFSNGLTLQIAQMLPGELKRLSDCLLHIFQVSGKVSDWIMALAEEEIDGIHKETPISKLRYTRRLGSDASHDSLGTGGGSSDREMIVRDMNKNAALEANLLFRGNTLLTKSLDSHMRRVGKEYLEEALMAKLREISEKDPDCEVDPNRVGSQSELDKNWRRLLLLTQDVWKAIVASKDRCPVELRVIFRHIRACAEDRYGDFLRSVSYSSVSGFLFLRFFCPAVLNPKLFGLLKGMYQCVEWVEQHLANDAAEDVTPRTRRTFTLITKSLQTLSNMASFGIKETWMEPMNAFLTQNRESFKGFIDDMCYVPAPLQPSTYQSSTNSSPTYPPGIASTETHLSYTTPMTIMQRLPPTSREGFPSLPYLIDQARAFAELVQLWLEATTAMSTSDETISNVKSHAEVMAAIKASEGDLMAFHEVCAGLHQRTQECLNRAERAERPNSALSFKWEEIIDQLQTNKDADGTDDEPTQSSFDNLGDKIAIDPLIVSPSTQPHPLHAREWNILPQDDDEDQQTRLYDTTPSQTGSQSVFEFPTPNERPGSSGNTHSLRDSLRRAQLQSRGSDSAAASASASVSNVSSAMSSDTEQADTTALPSYDREVRHRERRAAAKQQIKQEVEAARVREREKEKRKVRPPIVSALRKKKERESKGNASSSAEG